MLFPYGSWLYASSLRNLVSQKLVQKYEYEFPVNLLRIWCSAFLKWTLLRRIEQRITLCSESVQELIFVEVIFELKYSWIWLLNGSIYGFISLQWLAFPLHKVTSILMQCQGVSGRLTHKNLFVFWEFLREAVAISGREPDNNSPATTLWHLQWKKNKDIRL